MLTLEQLAAEAQTCAQQMGIHQYDIYGATIDETSVQVDRGSPKQVKASNRSSVIVRVWNQAGMVGVTSTTDVDPSGLALALQTAHEASDFGVVEHVPGFSPEATDPLPEPGSIASKAPQAPASALLEQLVEAEQQLLNAHPAIKGVPYNGLAQRDIDRFYLNSQGSLRQEGHSITSLYLYSRTEQEGRKPRSAGAMRLSPSLATLDVEGCLQEAAEKTISHLDYDRIPTGKYTVVFSPEAFLSLLGAFSNLFNAQSILDRQSLSKAEDLGSQLASPLLSVADDACHPEHIGGISFDGEGTPTRRVDLIKAGVLQTFLHSSVTAKRMGSQTTGHANIGAKVTVSPHFLHVFSAQTLSAPTDDLSPNSEFDLKTAKDVILIDDLHALHAGVKATQGSFSLPFDGWRIQAGERTSIESATVAGDFREVLKAIIYVDPVAVITPGGICPHIWVEGLSITGE